MDFRSPRGFPWNSGWIVRIRYYHQCTTPSLAPEHHPTQSTPNERGLGAGHYTQEVFVFRGPVFTALAEPQ